MSAAATPTMRRYVLVGPPRLSHHGRRQLVAEVMAANVEQAIRLFNENPAVAELKVVVPAGSDRWLPVGYEIQTRKPLAKPKGITLGPQAEALLVEARETIRAQAETIGTLTAERNEARAELEEAKAVRKRVLGLLYTKPVPAVRETWEETVESVEAALELIRRHRQALGLRPEPGDGNTIAAGIQRLKQELDDARHEAATERERAEAAERDARACAEERDRARFDLGLAREIQRDVEARTADARALHRAIDLTQAAGDSWRLMHDTMGEVLEVSRG